MHNGWWIARLWYVDLQIVHLIISWHLRPTPLGQLASNCLHIVHRMLHPGAAGDPHVLHFPRLAVEHAMHSPLVNTSTHLQVLHLGGHLTENPSDSAVLTLLCIPEHILQQNLAASSGRFWRRNRIPHCSHLCKFGPE
jgi:hypothetical protein